MIEPSSAGVRDRGFVSAWSSNDHPRHERHDAWAHVLSDFFLPWTVTSRPREDLSASVRQCRLDDCRYVYCASDSISGQRAVGDIGRTRDDYFNLLYILSGTELLKFQDREVLLPANHFVLWDSERRMEFSVLEPLQKLTLMVPERQMRALLPNAQDYVGIPVNGNHGLGRLFTDYLRAVQREAWQMSDGELMRLRTPTLELLARAFASVPGRSRRSGREETFRRIREHILERLRDADLTPQAIARGTGVSIRYLHLLFADAGTTVATWIRERRLERCRLDLANPQLTRRSISAIAYGWGFNDAGHFGKLFRKATGQSPRAFRRASAAAA
jgi:AraC family transcriptional regulator, positive regulator of tynA and feaB